MAEDASARLAEFEAKVRASDQAFRHQKRSFYLWIFGIILACNVLPIAIIFIFDL